jgi:preprotein translocase subunit YajC
LGSLIVIIAMFALLWLLLIRPQRARQQQQERMIDSVDVGDEILTSGGIIATVRGVDDDANELHVEIAPGIEVRMDRRAVGAIVQKDETDAEDEAVAEDEDAEPEEVELDGSAEEIRQRSLATAEAEIREETVNPVEDSVNDARNEDAATAAEQNRR